MNAPTPLPRQTRIAIVVGLWVTDFSATNINRYHLNVCTEQKKCSQQTQTTSHASHTFLAPEHEKPKWLYVHILSINTWSKSQFHLLAPKNLAFNYSIHTFIAFVSTDNDIVMYCTAQYWYLNTYIS